MEIFFSTCYLIFLPEEVATVYISLFTAYYILFIIILDTNYQLCLSQQAFAHHHLCVAWK